jgi:hypothetical protein
MRNGNNTQCANVDSIKHRKRESTDREEAATFRRYRANAWELTQQTSLGLECCKKILGCHRSELLPAEPCSL